MASLFTTMLVPVPPPPSFPLPPKVLHPVRTLEESTSQIRLVSEGVPPSPSGSAPASPSTWSWTGLFSASPVQALLGRRKRCSDIERHPPSQPASPDSRPRASIESLRESLHNPYRDSPGPLPRYSRKPLLQPLKNTHVDNFISHSNSKARVPFKPQRASKGTSNWQLRQFAEATLGSGSLRKAVKLPEGEDLNEWLAVNVVDFYNQINLLYGSITEFCSPQSCPEMKATDEFEYLWQDTENYKRPTKMPAPEYIEHLMTWCQSNIDNESLFPSRIGVPFPKTFPSLVRQMFKRLYRVYAHIYCHHYPVIIQLGLEPHLNTSFKHYVLFIDEHGLATGKDFWGPLGDLVDSMLKSD